MALKRKSATNDTPTKRRRSPDFESAARPRGIHIEPRNDKQKDLIKAIKNNDIIAAMGPAGTGKTYIEVAMAVQALYNPECPIDKIVITRPILEAGGDRLGYLPGGIKEKTDPYLRPIHDILKDLVGTAEMEKLLENEIIEVAPLAYIRGRTWKNTFAILDEAQNTTKTDMFMFLTRMGDGTKMLLNGDESQIDLPHHIPSGLVHANSILKGIESFASIQFTTAEVVRHPMVGRVIDAWLHDRKEQEVMAAFNPKVRRVS